MICAYCDEPLGMDEKGNTDPLYNEDGDGPFCSTECVNNYDQDTAINRAEARADRWS